MIDDKKVKLLVRKVGCVESCLHRAMRLQSNVELAQSVIDSASACEAKQVKKLVSEIRELLDHIERNI